MACSDKKTREFMNVPSGATYALKVTGPGGFSSVARFDDGRNNKIVMWSAAELRAGKEQKLAGPGKVHFVHLFVNIDPAQNITVKVEASVDGKSYCRTVSGKGTQEIIVHTLRMEPAS